MRATRSSPGSDKANAVRGVRAHSSGHGRAVVSRRSSPNQLRCDRWIGSCRPKLRASRTSCAPMHSRTALIRLLLHEIARNSRLMAEERFRRRAARRVSIAGITYVSRAVCARDRAFSRFYLQVSPGFRFACPSLRRTPEGLAGREIQARAPCGRTRLVLASASAE